LEKTAGHYMPPHNCNMADGTCFKNTVNYFIRDTEEGQGKALLLYNTSMPKYICMWD